MIVIYKTVLQKLSEIPALRWIDKDKGQLDFGSPPVAFPCGLITIKLPKCEDLGGNIQQCSGSFSIKLAWRFTGESSNITPEAIRNQSLEYYQLAEDAYKKLQGYSTSELSPFSRKRVDEEIRPDGLIILTMQFDTDFQDFTAVV